MKKVTLSTLAKQLKLSPSTVSFVLNGREMGISHKTRERVIKKAVELGYRKLPMFDMQGWTRVAFISANIQFFNFGTSFFAGVYSQIQQKSVESKIELFLLELAPDKSPEHAFQNIEQIKSMGIEICLTSSHVIVELLREQGIPSVLVQGGKMQGCVCVYCDDFAAGEKAAEYAVENGHRNAGMIFPKNYEKHPRFSGFMKKFTELGGKVNPKHICFHEFRHDIIEKDIAKFSKIGKLPSFFYCFADNVMFPAIRGFAANGIRVPEDVSIMGTDNLYWGQYSLPAFSTIDLNEELFAEKTIEAVKHVKAGGAPYELAVPVKLLARETVRSIT